jgi:hypothetical protein
LAWSGLKSLIASLDLWREKLPKNGASFISSQTSI